MCGRFTLAAPQEKVEREFSIKSSEQGGLFTPRYNIAPSQFVPVVRELENERAVSALKWGLIPSWAKDDSFAAKMINARAETLAEKPSFREPFKSRRCLVPASGFYEWEKTSSGAKQPHYFYLKNQELFAFAALWEEWLDRDSGELLETFTVITTEANDVLKPVHDRMPVIVKREDYSEWLDAKIKDTGKLEKFLVPYPADKMSSHPVSRAVNSPFADAPELILNSK